MMELEAAGIQEENIRPHRVRRGRRKSEEHSRVKFRQELIPRRGRQRRD